MHHLCCRNLGVIMASIFVQIAAYHDYELEHTIMRAITNSSGDNQINFGVHLLFKDVNDILIPSLPNINYSVSKAPEGIGLGVCRSKAHNFYNGEDYYLQIDSHSIMDPMWDTLLIGWVKEYQAMGFEKPLITQYPRNYWYENNVLADRESKNTVTQISFHEKIEQFKEQRIGSQTAVPNPKDNIFSNSVSGGSVFTVGSFQEPNVKIAFWGEEPTMAARAFTDGYDLFIPKHSFMAHLYFKHEGPTNEDRFKLNKRRIIWADYPDEFNVIDKISKAEVYDLFTKQIKGPQHLGTKRTLEDFGLRSGLDFSTGEVFTQYTPENGLTQYRYC